LSDNFPIQIGLKQGDALSSLLFNFTLEYDIIKVQENQAGVKLNGTHQLTANAHNVNLLEDDIYAIEKTEILFDANNDVGLDENIAVSWAGCRSKS
jgi:hypothetical protein